jgi:hypothetical protein
MNCEAPEFAYSLACDKIPARRDSEKKQGILHVYITTVRTGYVPGMSHPVSNNNSSVD